MGIHRPTATRTIPAIIAAAILSLGAIAATLGYEGEVPATVTMTTAGAVLAGEPIDVCATVLGPSGTGVPDITVTFDITSSPAGADDVLSSTTGVSDGDGVACVELTLDAVVGSRTITASAEGEAVGTITIVLAASGLPNTAAAPGFGGMLVPLVILLAISGAIGLLHERVIRRRGSNS